MMSEDADFKDLHICARCATCGIIFDVAQGLECPACKRNQISFAWKSSQSAEFWNRGAVDRDDEPGFAKEGLAPYPHCLNTYGTACADDCPCCCWLEEQAREKKFAQPSIDECVRIFSLIDPR